jgi:hypothetical protein
MCGLVEIDEVVLLYRVPINDGTLKVESYMYQYFFL